jgi:hypothetical protein
MFTSRLSRSVAAGAAAVAVAVGGIAIGSSSSSNGAGTATAAQTTTPAAQTGAPAAPPSQPLTPGQPHKASTPTQAGQIPKGWKAGQGTVVTGAAADKAKAAAIAAGYKGTVNRVLKLSDGSYAVHFIGTTGPHHVFVSAAFQVTGYATSG